MDKPRIIEKYESIKEHQEQLAKEEGKELVYDIESEMQQDYNDIMSGKRLSFGNKHKLKNLAKAQELQYGLEFLKTQKKTTNSKSIEQATIRQTAIALYFMRKAEKFPKKSGSYKTDANFLFYLTGVNPDKMRKLISNPFARPDNSQKQAINALIKDIQSVRVQFELIQFQTGITLVDQKLQELENDLESF
ncbi:hypothetical protein [Carboxylicivirga marina]|uniref:Uncharacterized protein n=1 Tax=Carboxylicivirga marina TaxID=2800988 RepID=A0ABS1HJD5_9BACT|nr:hypothetical protein [Carboxylicivirga marina]MBK3517715.1 hypothetical protein [Carboxylicivirga marina]